MEGGRDYDFVDLSLIASFVSRPLRVNIFVFTRRMNSMCVGCLLFALDLSDGNLQPYDRAYLENLWPRFEPDPYTGTTPDIFACLALIYPCVTGMLAGMSRATHLARPERSIPRGMFMAIVTSSSIYLVVCWLFGICISNRTLKVDKFVTASVSYPHELIVRVGVVVSCLGLILGCMSSAPSKCPRLCVSLLAHCSNSFSYAGHA